MKFTIPPASRRHAAGTAALIVAILCATAAVADEALQSLSLLDFAGLERQVEQRIRSRIEEVRHRPRSGEAWGRLAMSLDVHDFKAESISSYKRAASLAPKDFRWIYYCAITLKELGSPEAVNFLEQSCRLKPAYGPAHLRYGQALLNAGRIKEAEKEFLTAASLSPDASHPSLELARVALLQMDIEKSHTNALEALKKKPDHGEAHALLAEIYRRKNDLQSAAKELMLSQSLDTKTPPEDPLLADLLSEGVSSFWYEWRGRTYLKQGNHEAAIAQLQLAVQALPEPRLHDILGIAFQSAGRYKEAIEQHHLALSANPGSAPTLNNLAAALAALGRAGQAISYLKQAIDSEPEFKYSYLHLSWLFATNVDATLRNGLEAIQLAEPICQVNDWDARCFDILAAAYAETGNFTKAVEAAARAHQLATDIGDSSYAERIQARLKRYEKGKPYHE